MFDYIQAISSFISDPVTVSFVLGALPISEVRGAAIYSFSINQPSLIIPAILANIAVCPLILLFWKILNIPKIASLILGKSLESRLLKFGKSYESQGILALILFIGIPLPLTGVYTGTLLAEILGIKREKILFASIIGVLLSASIMYLILSGFFSLI
jgi:uncharacterized membrane protein